MPGLTDESVRAILRLQAYKPPKTSYDSMPLSRRAAVLVLLFPDIHGRLRVVLTLRSEQLRNFAGQVALPGGKADTLTETPEDTARREAYEEIGLPLPNHNFVLLAPPSWNSSDHQSLDAEKQQIRFSVTHLTELPCHFSQNNLSVRPVVAVLLPASIQKDVPHSPSDVVLNSVNKLDIPIDLESLLIPRLDPKEVSAVFSIPLEAFLATTYAREYTKPPTPTSEDWYRGKLQNWYGRDWYMHEFMAPVWAHKAVTAGRGAARVGYNDKLMSPEETVLLARGSKIEEEKEEVLMHYRVWGMTARILIDVARIAYEKEPEFECLKEKGDEDVIAWLLDHGMLKEERKHGEEFFVNEMFKKGNL
ncbi:hypothetical protein L211DRAFT_609335 [Terfezia boudieri ATCC MYA-4762]|uniref:Nudix hydrolase domain-containing protein n=1 Tax=Terfezia boudieri ATCC MYA-4762 TaxID=1051890 RepID=A0A3N4LW69_9PEZI|nr:hypothetical protein L211DRAFT_609335 [Terfezia boudieri ATCC MYA-4762]